MSVSIAMVAESTLSRDSLEMTWIRKVTCLNSCAELFLIRPETIQNGRKSPSTLNVLLRSIVASVISIKRESMTVGVCCAAGGVEVFLLASGLGSQPPNKSAAKRSNPVRFMPKILARDNVEHK